MVMEQMQIVISLIGAIASPLSAIIGIMASSKLMAYRLEQLENKVAQHNNLIDRMYKVESDVEVIQEKQSVANHRIDDIERKIN